MSSNPQSEVHQLIQEPLGKSAMSQMCSCFMNHDSLAINSFQEDKDASKVFYFYFWFELKIYILVSETC